MSTQEIQHYEDNKIENLLVGRSIVEVKDDLMILDNGTLVRVQPNEGCGGCASGWYQIDELNKCESVITSARVVNEDIAGEDAHVYKIFVLAANKEQMVLSVSGDDGNGYYGTGYTMFVTLDD